MKIPSAANPKVQSILDYISQGWDVLTRSTATCEAVTDPKLIDATTLYLPADVSTSLSAEKLSRDCNIELAHLSSPIRKPGQIPVLGDRPDGLLFLENPYVVPGGRFNEMYGWDSYFIIRGLLRDDRLDLARGMVDNFFFEIEHYGSVLNANRTYYLSRSQPPFLSSMTLAIYDSEKARGHADRDWLARAYQYLNHDYEMWARAPHLAGSTGLSRYYDFGEGPVHEGLHDEIDYYHNVLSFFLQGDQPSRFVMESHTPEALLHRKYSRRLCDEDAASVRTDKCDLTRHVALSPEYYKGDRSMRESGFDISFRFGPYGAETHHYAPVCLNSLLYKTEKDMESISLTLGDSAAAANWHECAHKRRELIEALLWNPQAGMYFDYDFKKKQQASYEYATTFYPLWANLASPDRARAVAENIGVFEQAGGLAMSTKETGVQWDYPYGWAPIQLLAVEGLRRYGYDAAADRVSLNFLSMVLANFQRDGNIREKYDVVTDSSIVQVAQGYRDNIIGFGWTNAVFVELWNGLPPAMQSRLGSESFFPD